MRPRVGTTAVWATVLVLIAAVVAFAGIRIATDLPFLLEGRPAEGGSFEERYVLYTAPAYLHIIPGVVYLLGACLQLSSRFRTTHPRLHRRLGRIVLAAGLLSGVFAIVFGAPLSYGGLWQSLATVVFASYFLAALGLAFRAILRRDIRTHRRWMIRAFAVGVAVGTIRLWVGLFAGLGDLSLGESLAPAFWIAFTMHAAAAELYLRYRPRPTPRTAHETRTPG